MPFTLPRTWVTGELLTSGQLNTYVRDNTRYLHGDDGPIELVAPLYVPSLYVNNVPVGGDANYPTRSTNGRSMALFTGGGISLMHDTLKLPRGRAFHVVGRCAVQPEGSGDAGASVLVQLQVTGAFGGVLDEAQPTLPNPMPAGRGRIDLTLTGYVEVPPAALDADGRVLIAAQKVGGNGVTSARGLSISAYPL